MRLTPDLRRRKSIRLQGFDYSQVGFYFVTVCTYQRKALFGAINDGRMVLNEVGMHVEKCWYELSIRFSTVCLHEYVTMPNHIHGIIQISPSGNASLTSLGDVVGAFKSISANSCRAQLAKAGSASVKLWQRNYHEHVIRCEADYLNIAQYIQNNPLRWNNDIYHASS